MFWYVVMLIIVAGVLSDFTIKIERRRRNDKDK